MTLDMEHWNRTEISHIPLGELQKHLFVQNFFNNNFLGKNSTYNLGALEVVFFVHHKLLNFIMVATGYWATVSKNFLWIGPIGGLSNAIT